MTANDVSNSVSVLPGTGTGSFGAKSDFGTGLEPRTVALADLNNDGVPDLVSANFASSTISVLPGTAEGSFGSKTDFSAGTGSRAALPADVDGDGKLDIVTANVTANSLSVLVNTTVLKPSGWFGDAKADYPTGLYPAHVVVADFDRDGNPDLVVTNNEAKSVSIILGTGKGSFGAKADYAIGNDSSGVAVADLNRDGKLDLAVANSYDKVAVLLGDGTGKLGPRTDFATGGGVAPKPFDVAVADVNRDGKPDLVVANYGANTVSTLLGTGTGSFGAPTEYVTGNSPTSVGTADLDLDGKPDLIVLARAEKLCVHLASTGFGFRTEYATGAAPAAFALADIDLDGKIDAAVTNSLSGTVTVLFGTTTGGFAAADYNVAAASPSGVALGDVNGDGKTDLVVATRGESVPTVSVFLGTGDGKFQAKTEFESGQLDTGDVAIADVNRDGKAELIVVKPLSQLVSVHLNTAPPASDLSVTVADAPDPVVQTAILTYTVTVVNNGPNTAYGVTLRAVVPNGTSLFSVTTPTGTCQGASTLTCAIGTLSQGNRI